ncbi:MAG TPA: thioesterase family protein [Spirochaetota bacterium]|mgnify:CR=1 FL=1|nr:thioesterase family protein [Spirochaetota bacterium]HPH01945.1 thioesterase family protein [Spirochaetota bacterium]HPN83101.1 thioesterase family protein [Spirochaetota bacterium]
MSVTSSLPVSIADINYGQHMGNDRFLAFFHEARLNFLASVSASEVDIGEDTGLIMTEANVRYLGQVVRGDLLETTVDVLEVKKSGFVLGYEMYRSQDGKRVASGTTALCAFKYAEGKIARLPGGFKQALEAHLRQPEGDRAGS